MTLELRNVTKSVGAERAHPRDQPDAGRGDLQRPARHDACRQDHADAADGRARQAEQRRDLVPRQERHRRPGAEAQRLDGLSAVHQLSAFHRLREHRLAAARGRCRRCQDQGARGQGRGAAAPGADAAEASPPSCPAASSSARRSRARWSRIPTSSCSTSRSPISTTSCARNCATSCRGCSPTGTASWSMPPPSRSRRCCSAATPRPCMRGG